MWKNINSIEETNAYAVDLSTRLKPGDIVCLVGDLGTGKTTFTQFLASALGVDAYVTSPSFSIMNAYTGELDGAPIPIYHFDVYRISDPDEMDEIGFDEFLFGDGISIIEWADLIEDHLPGQAIWLELKLDEMGNRMISETVLAERTNR